MTESGTTARYERIPTLDPRLQRLPPSPPPCRVCFVAGEYPPTPGGLARSAQRVARFIASGGHEVHVVVPDRDAAEWNPGRVMASRESSRVSVHRVPADPERTHETGLRLARALRELDDQLDFEVFHAFFLPLAVPCAAAMRARPRPLIGSARGADGVVWLQNPVQRALVRTALRACTWITAVSEELLVSLDQVEPIRQRGSVIRNSVNPTEFRPWTPEGHVRGRVGSVGKFQPAKCVPLLVESYARLPRSLRHDLLLVGDFPDSEERRRSLQMAEETEVADEVHVTGYVTRETVIGRLPTMRVFVLCSDREGMPNALLEAAAAGVPLVTTAVGAAKELMRHGTEGILVPTGDATALSGALREVLADDALAAHLSAGARNLARGFDPEAERDAWLRLYDELRRVGQEPTS